MGALTSDMQRLIREQMLGFVASVDEDGTPNLSPKGTMVVLDDDHIIFGNIRSPNTVANLRRNPVIEINFVDQFVRKGYRFKGTAEYIERGTKEFGELYDRFEQWGDLSKEIQGIVKLRVERARPLSTPAYDIGATEKELRAHWQDHFKAIQPEDR